MKGYSEFKSILYKLSGESLCVQNPTGKYDEPSMLRICRDIVNVKKLGKDICIVVGGGNIVRGRTISQIGIDKISGDYMGMLSTVMNAIALKSTFKEKFNCDAKVFSALQIEKMCNHYNVDDARDCLSSGSIVIFATGIGSPFFSTDTAAAIRGIEMNCDVLIKGTTVDGVYSSDPKKDPNAKFYDTISYSEVINKRLGFMDTSAAMLLEKNNLSSIIFSISKGERPLSDLLDLNKNIKHTFVQNSYI